MKIIKMLEERISDEIEDVGGYAKMAAEVKSEWPALSHVLYTISTQEEGHVEMLHAEVVKLIEQHRKTRGEPPATMLAVYDFLHKKHIEDLAKAKNYQEIYKKM